jgi:hypothetical protein
MDNLSWRYLITYCCFLAVEVCFVYFLFPETRSVFMPAVLLDTDTPFPVAAPWKNLPSVSTRVPSPATLSKLTSARFPVFEPKELSDKAVAAVDRIIHDPRSPISEKDEKAEKASV